MKKRFLSILLTLTMLLSLFPGMAVTVSAAESIPVDENIGLSEYTNGRYLITDYDYEDFFENPDAHWRYAYMTAAEGDAYLATLESATVGSVVAPQNSEEITSEFIPFGEHYNSDYDRLVLVKVLNPYSGDSSSTYVVQKYAYFKLGDEIDSIKVAVNEAVIPEMVPGQALASQDNYADFYNFMGNVISFVDGDKLYPERSGVYDLVAKAPGGEWKSVNPMNPIEAGYTYGVLVRANAYWEFFSTNAYYRAYFADRGAGVTLICTNGDYNIVAADASLGDLSNTATEFAFVVELVTVPGQAGGEPSNNQVTNINVILDENDLPQFTVGGTIGEEIELDVLTTPETNGAVEAVGIPGVMLSEDNFREALESGFFEMAVDMLGHTPSYTETLAIISQIAESEELKGMDPRLAAIIMNGLNADYQLKADDQIGMVIMVYVPNGYELAQNGTIALNGNAVEDLFVGPSSEIFLFGHVLGAPQPGGTTPNTPTDGTIVELTNFASITGNTLTLNFEGGYYLADGGPISSPITAEVIAGFRDQFLGGMGSNIVDLSDNSITADDIDDYMYKTVVATNGGLMTQNVEVTIDSDTNYVFFAFQIDPNNKRVNFDGGDATAYAVTGVGIVFVSNGEIVVSDQPGGTTPPADEAKAIVNLGADSFSVDENGKVTFNLPEEDGYFYYPIVMPADAMEGSGITAQQYVEYFMEGTKHNVLDVTDAAAFDISDMETAATLSHSPSGSGQVFITNAVLDGDDLDWTLYTDSIVAVMKLSADNMVSGAYGADYFPGAGFENVYVYGIYGVYAALVEFEGEEGGDDVTDGFVAELGTDWISRSDNTVTINVPNGEKYMLGIVKHADDEDAKYYREYFNDFVGEQIMTSENWEYVYNDCSVGIYDGEIDGEYYGYVGIEELSTSDGTPIVLNITEDQSIFLFHVSATPFLQDMTGYKMYAILGVHAGSYTCGSDVPTPPVEPDEPKTESNVNSDSFEEGELTVEGLIDEAEAWLEQIEGANPTDDIKVAVNMNVEVKASDVVNPTEKDAIEDIASAQSSNLEYLDITIEKTVLINDVKSDADSGPISETHDLIEIEIVFPTAGKSNFKVYRYHDGAVQVLTETTGADGERIVVGDGKITIKAKFFSTYAVGYEDNNGPVHVNYTDSNLTDFYWDGTTNLTIADEAVITIIKPYTQKANLTISANATILGNGKTITSHIGNNLYETIIVNNGANVLMKDVSIERVTTGYIKKNLILIDGAALTCENISVNVEVMGVFELLNNGSLIVKGDNTTITSESDVDNGRPIFDNKAGTVTIMAGEYTRSGNSGQIVGNGATATVNIQGGTFKNPEGNTDTIANGIINMTGGTIISTKAAAIRSGKTGDKVTITGGTIMNSAKAVRLGRDTDASAGEVIIGGNVIFSGNTVDVYLTLKNNVSNVVTIRDDFTGRVSVKSSKTLATNEKLPITTTGTAKELRSQVYSADANLAVSFENTGYLYLWKHVHDYTQDMVDDEYLVSPATCDALAVYLKSCECGNGSDDASKIFASGSLRTHNYVFQSDEMYHWDECSYDDCKDVINKAAHTYTEFHSDEYDHWYECSDADCVVNNGKVAHTYTEFHSDADDHWYECSHAACTANNGKVAHTYTEFHSDADDHWYECSNGDCTANNGKVAHTYTEFHSDADDHWYECSHAECVVNNGKVDHTFTEFHSNDGYHWYECSHDACAVKSGEAAHSFTQFESNGVHHWYECSHVACTKISDETSHDFVRMTDNNYHWYECSDPACKFVKDKEAHTSSNWIVDVYEQVDVNGRMHKECTVCEHVLATVVIPALSPEKKDDHDDVVVKPDFTSCPKDATCPVWSFKDATAFEWYHDGVHYCIENGLMNGLPENLFDPAGATTRAQIVTILWRMEGQPLVAVAEGFNDVSDSDWYNNAVRWASANGIAEGYGDGIFAPNDVITREQMVTILWRYAMYKGFDVSVGVETNILSYGDAFDIAHYAIPAMQWACGSGLVTGIADENGGMILDPQGATTRAQTATMLMRFCVEIEK